MTGATFTLEQAMAAQKALREMLGSPAETFSVPAFVGMINDQIEQLWDRGKSEREIVNIMERACGVAVSTDDIVRFYATPSDRAR